MSSMQAEEAQCCDDDSCDDFEEAAEVCTEILPLPVYALHSYQARFTVRHDRAFSVSSAVPNHIKR